MGFCFFARFILLLTSAIPLIVGTPAFGAPKDESRFERLTGGMYQLESGMVVQGSVNHGGLQPDYEIDFHSAEFQKLKVFAQQVKKNKRLSVWKKIEWLVSFIQREALPKGDYNDPDYLRLLSEYRSLGKDIPLSAYMKCQAGVCRENAMFLHLALKEAGVENRFVYAKVQQQEWQGKKVTFDATEDHAFTVVAVDGKNWIVDSYNTNFHGYSFDQLANSQLNKNATLERSKLAY